MDGMCQEDDYRLRLTQELQTACDKCPSSANRESLTVFTGQSMEKEKKNKKPPTSDGWKRSLWIKKNIYLMWRTYGLILQVSFAFIYFNFFDLFEELYSLKSSDSHQE